MSRWFRMYADVLDDPKVQKLPLATFKTWVNLLCLASRNDGLLPPIEDIAFALRLDEDVTRDMVRDMISRGLLDEDDGLTPHNWNERQFKSDKDQTAAERKRAQREREKLANVTGNVTRDVTNESRPPEQNRTEADTDQIRVAPRATSELLEAKLREAAGWQSEPAPGLFVTGPIETLIANGADLDLDVLPVIRGRASKVRRPASWAYFTGPIQDAMEARRTAGTGPPGRINGAKSEPSKSFEELAQELVPGWKPGTKAAGGIA